MRIIRSKATKNFTTVSNFWIKDTTLSAKAKGIFIYLLSLPENWDLHMTELVTHFTDGERAIRSGIKELMKVGYVKCNIVRQAGKISGNEYYLIEDPYTQKQDVQNVDIENAALLNTNKRLNTNNNIVDLTKYAIAIKVLNGATGRNYKTDNRKNLGKVKARVKDGSSIEEVCEIVKFICKKRMGTDYEMYLRPSTIFNRTKFENYKEEYKYVTKDLTKEQKYAILNTETLLNKTETLKDLY